MAQVGSMTLNSIVLTIVVYFSKKCLQ